MGSNARGLEGDEHHEKEWDISGKESGSFTRAVTILMIGVAALAFTAPWVKQANFEPATSAILRVGIALFVLLPLAWRERQKLGSLNKTGVILAVVAGLFLGIDFTAWNYSIFYVGAGIASVLLNLQIIILPALAMIFDQYHAPKSFFVLVPIMILGVALTGGIFDAAPSEGPATVYGINIAVLGTILGAVSGVCYGIYLYTSRKSTTVNPGRILQPMAWVCAAQLVAPVLFILLFSDRGFDLTHGVMISGKLPMNPETTVGDPITAMNWFWMIILATAGQAMAWTFVQYGSVRMDPTIVAGLLLLSPVSTVFIAGFMFGEVPSSLQILGVVVVLAAVAYQNKLHVALKNRLSPAAPAG
ncbi:MAG TPA: DMT family transporter [Thermomicrobiales bacterium]|nr:DMT family transporter [Thermomicrobiales bacterium]